MFKHSSDIYPLPCIVLGVMTGYAASAFRVAKPMKTPASPVAVGPCNGLSASLSLYCQVQPVE